MGNTYTEALISDEATDEDSPVNETLVQGIAQSLNYVQDAVFDGGGNSETIGTVLYHQLATSSIFTCDGSNMDTDFYIYIPAQYDGIDISFRCVVDFADSDLDSDDALVLTIGSGSDTETEGGAGGAARVWTGTITPGSTGIVLCNFSTTGVGSGEDLNVSAVLLYIAST